MPRKIYFYIAKNFFLKFINVLLAIFLLIFIINLFDILAQIQDMKSVGWFNCLSMAALTVPSFIEDISIFIIMLSAMITLFNFSVRSEIIIMRSAGLSLWHILMPIAVSTFFLGIIFILFFNRLTIVASKEFVKMENKFINKEEHNILVPTNGIWLKQQNIDAIDEFIIIKAKEIDRNNLKFFNVNLWFFNINGEFYRKIDAKNMFLNGNVWQLSDLIINSDNEINLYLPNITIPTNLGKEFITQKILNNFEEVKSFSIFELPKLIIDLREAGFAPRKFTVYYNYLLARPMMFVAIALIAAFFSINHLRSGRNILYMVVGTISGLVLYVSSSVINAFGFSGLLPPFVATWLSTIIFLALGILLVFKKENI